MSFFYNPVEITVNNKKVICDSNTLFIFNMKEARVYGNLKESWSQSWFFCKGNDALAFLNKTNIKYTLPNVKY